MLKQPIDSRGNNKYFLEFERIRIAKINKTIGDIDLTPKEERLLWLCGWEESKLNNIISVIQKVKS